MMEAEATESTVDVKRLVASLVLLVSGIVTALKSRGVWVELAFVDFRVSSDWYGKVVFVVGIILAFTSLVSFFDSIEGKFTAWLKIAATLAGVVGLIIAVSVGFRVRQIASDVASRSRAPERWFEGTILESLGRLASNVSESVSSVAQPKLASDWKTTLAALAVGTIAAAVIAPWREARMTSEPEENASE